MGVYARQEKEGFSNSPVYRKPLQEKYMFLAETGNWMISSVPGGKTGNIFQESGGHPLPLEHVEWFSASSEEHSGFEVDRTVSVLPREGKEGDADMRKITDSGSISQS